MNWRSWTKFLVWGGCLLLLPLQAAFGQGIFLSATGPVNRSMGGAAVAAPIEAIGAIRWNPATISALPCSELGFGTDLLWPLIRVESSIPGFGSGSTEASAGATPIPSIGWVHKVEETPLTLGLGIMGTAGFRTNYPSSLTNPILFPPSNTPGTPGGLGSIFTSAQFFDIAPTMSLAVSDQLSIGFSPILTMGEVVVDPLVIAPPNDADGSGAPRYGSGRGTQMQWGGAFQIGGFYILNEDWRVGASFRSPTWSESFTYQTTNEVGEPSLAKFNWTLPLVTSAGISYAGIESTLIALDLRFVDYNNASGFNQQGFNPDGSLRGLGWKSVFALALGIQRELTEKLTLRGGYTYNTNPTPSELTSINVAAPLYYQHQLSAGASYLLAPNVSLNTAFAYYLPNDITGPILTPTGPIPGSSVTSSESVYVASAGVTVKY